MTLNDSQDMWLEFPVIVNTSNKFFSTNGIDTAA